MATDTKGDLSIKSDLMGHCTKKDLYGHWFTDGKCIECGLTKAEFSRRFSKAKEA